MRPPPSPTRSRTRGHRTATAPMPVTISRSGRCPWRTSRRRPSSVNLSVWVLSQAATSASTACPNSVLAPLRKTSVSGSENVPGWVSSKTLVSVTAYHSFGGEVEVLNTPHDTPPYPFMPSPTFGLSSSTEFDRVSWNVPMIVYGITGYTASSCTVTPSNYQCIPAGKTPPTNPNTTGQNIV